MRPGTFHKITIKRMHPVLMKRHLRFCSRSKAGQMNRRLNDKVR